MPHRSFFRRTLSVGALIALLFAPSWSTSMFRAEKPFLPAASAAEQPTVYGDNGMLPALDELVTSEKTSWLNSAPLSRASLRGKVVLVDFWTYSCINSLRNIPYIQSWSTKYKDAGLVVVGVHTPEFSFEKDLPNIENAVRELNVTYPVAIDSSYAIWNAFNNEYWPADYLVDRKGRIRFHHFGEGDYADSEHNIQALLNEDGAASVAHTTMASSGRGIEAPPSDITATPETYVGYHRADSFASPERMARDTARTYTVPAKPSLNHWGFGGTWNVGGESAVLASAPGKIVFRFHSRDLHFVLGPANGGKPIRFKVRLDGKPPGDDHGGDTAADGSGEVREPRLYQLIRQKHAVEDRTFEIEFLDPGVHAYVFTFG
jgi:thiol-disulfide isomerase/thioredoxin